MESRPAGLKIVEFFTNTPLGEEVLDGVMGGSVAGLSQVGSDKSAGQIGLETAAAILGGIGMGAAGRRIGARIGRAVHKDPLKDQGSMPAFIGRTFGNDTTAKGLKENAIMGREALKESILQDTSMRMAREAVENPQGFAAKYGVTPETFSKYAEQVKAGRMTAGAMKAVESMPPEQRKELLNKMAQQYSEVEDAIGTAAYSSFDEKLKHLVQNRDTAGQSVEEVFGVKGLGDVVSRSLEGLDRPVQEVTGAHVGKAIGRFIGDEVGVLGGMAGGSLLAQQLGIESPKDVRIRELERQLAGGA